MIKSKPTVLIIDDDDGFQIRLSALLRRAGYYVASASNGDEALRLLEADNTMPDVIVLDLVMPVMDGWRFREIQEKSPKIGHIPVVVVADAPIEKEYYQSLRANAVVRKPIDRAKILRVIDKARVLRADCVVIESNRSAGQQFSIDGSTGFKHDRGLR